MAQLGYTALICRRRLYLLRAAADYPRIRAVATAAAHLRDRANDLAWLGSEEVIAERLARGLAALENMNERARSTTCPASTSAATTKGCPAS